MSVKTLSCPDSVSTHISKVISHTGHMALILSKPKVLLKTLMCIFVCMCLRLHVCQSSSLQSYIHYHCLVQSFYFEYKLVNHYHRILTVIFLVHYNQFEVHTTVINYYIILSWLLGDKQSKLSLHYGIIYCILLPHWSPSNI